MTSTSQFSSTKPDLSFYENNMLRPPDLEIVNLRHSFKCDKSVVQFPPQKFDYQRFSIFLQTKTIVERQTRWKLIELDEPVLKTSDLTDKHLMSELVGMYGPMDEDSPEFKKIFLNYKTERIEQINEWVAEEEEYINNIGIDEGYVDISSLFTTNELNAFTKVKEVSSHCDQHFALPRKKLSSKQIFSKTNENPSLNILDPELHIPFILPSVCDVHVGEKLAIAMYELIKRHPTGITCTRFVLEFEKENNYFPNALNYGSFMEMINDLGHHVIFVQKFDTDTMLYPMCLQGLIGTPEQTFFHILHKIKVVLNLCYGIVNVNEVLSFCRKIFGWGKLDVYAWGFESEQEFVLYLIDRWPCHTVSTISEDKILPKGNPLNKYLIVPTESRSKLLKSQEDKLVPVLNKVEAFGSVHSSSVFSCQYIHSRFMQPGQTIPDEMSNHKAGDVLFMVVPYFVSPTNFSLIRSDMWNTVGELGDKLRSYCEREEKLHGKESLMINPRLISPGYCCVLINKNGEYFRAQYLKEKDGWYECCLLDYGDVEFVQLENLRYLDIKVGTKIPTQAFHCRLNDVSSPHKDKNGNDLWEDNVVKFAYESMVPDVENPTPLKVFLKRFIKKSMQPHCVVWMCDRKRKIKDFGLAIMEFVEKNKTSSQ